VERVTVEVLGENRQMLEVCREVGFHFEHAVGPVLRGAVRLADS
jgi:hypothetical protein